MAGILAVLVHLLGISGFIETVVTFKRVAGWWKMD